MVHGDPPAEQPGVDGVDEHPPLVVVRDALDATRHLGVDGRLLGRVGEVEAVYLSLIHI